MESIAASQSSTGSGAGAPGVGTSVLLLGNDRNQIGAARSLKRAGYRIVIGRGDDTCYAELSRHADEIWHHP